LFCPSIIVLRSLTPTIWRHLTSTAPAFLNDPGSSKSNHLIHLADPRGYDLCARRILIGKFRFSASNWDAGLSWVIPLVLPVLAFMIPTWTIRQTKKNLTVLNHSHVFFAAVFCSLLYFLALFGVLLRLPREIGDIEKYVDEVMRTSSWYLGTAQALIIVILGKLFLEDIGEEPGVNPSQTAIKQ